MVVVVVGVAEYSGVTRYMRLYIGKGILYGQRVLLLAKASCMVRGCYYWQRHPVW